MSRPYDVSDFSRLLEKTADDHPLGRSRWSSGRRHGEARPEREEVVRERLANLYRKTYPDRTRNYPLRESEIFMLKELGKFRVISAEDLSRFGYDDAGLYRLYQLVATEIEKNGGSVRRVILDYELKEQLYRDLNKTSAPLSEVDRNQVAAKHGLKVVHGCIPIPDLRIEFENDAKEIERVDLELATREYRSQGLATKARAGFRLYAHHQDVDRLRRVMNQEEITARIFAL